MNQLHHDRRSRSLKLAMRFFGTLIALGGIGFSYMFYDEYRTKHVIPTELWGYAGGFIIAAVMIILVLNRGRQKATD